VASCGRSIGSRRVLARRLSVVILGAVMSLGAACEDLLLNWRLLRQPSKASETAPAPKEPVAEQPLRPDAVAEEGQITTDPSPELWPVVSRDGQSLFFTSRKTGNFELFRLDLANPRLQYQLTGGGDTKCRSAISADGNTVVLEVLSDPRRDLFSLARLSLPERRMAPLVSRPIHVLTPDLSPNGRRLAFALVEAPADAAKFASCLPPLHEALGVTQPPLQPSIWVASVDGTGPVYLGRGFYPRWSLDGRRLTFVSRATGNADLWLVGVDGSNLTQLTSDPSDEIDPAWSPDGTRLVFASDRRVKGNFDLWLIDLRDGRLVQLTGDPGHDGGPAWSPDGRYVYFHSSRNGNWDLYRVIPLLR